MHIRLDGHFGPFFSVFKFDGAVMTGTQEGPNAKLSLALVDKSTAIHGPPFFAVVRAYNTNLVSQDFA